MITWFVIELPCNQNIRLPNEIASLWFFESFMKLVDKIIEKPVMNIRKFEFWLNSDEGSKIRKFKFLLTSNRFLIKT